MKRFALTIRHESWVKKVVIAGLAQRRTLWWPTWKGWIAILGSAVALAIGFFAWLHPFLAVTRAENGNILVVEGWISDHAIADAKSLFEERGYEWLVVSGCALPRGAFLQEYKTYAGVGSATLIAMGFPEDSLLSAPAGECERNRTFQSARACLDLLSEKEIVIKGVDVVTLATHGRRSRLVYKKLFGDFGPVGVYSIAPQSYVPKRWWASSEGLKTTMIELVAFGFERFANAGRSGKGADLK